VESPPIDLCGLPPNRNINGPVHRIFANKRWIHHIRKTGILTSPLAGSIWLKRWAERNAEAGGNPEIGKYIGIYFVFGIGAAALTVVQTLILWIFCSIEVCRP
jgi:hypothetical protein